MIVLRNVIISKIAPKNKFNLWLNPIDKTIKYFNNGQWHILNTVDFTLVYKDKD